jgi:TRAP-type uncharacterized transport system fused permease subunit
VLITCETSIGAFLLLALLHIDLVTITYISFIPALVEYQPSVYSALVFSPATRKMKMDWNSLTRSSRLALPRLHIHMDYGAFCCCAFVRVILLFESNIYVINILYS